LIPYRSILDAFLVAPELSEVCIVFSRQSSLLHHEVSIAKSLLCLLFDVVMPPIFQLCFGAIRKLASHALPVGPEEEVEFSKTAVFVRAGSGMIEVDCQALTTRLTRPWPTCNASEMALRENPLRWSSMISCSLVAGLEFMSIGD
jgi:hypothetical protein